MSRNIGAAVACVLVLAACSSQVDPAPNAAPGGPVQTPAPQVSPRPGPLPTPVVKVKPVRRKRQRQADAPQVPVLQPRGPAAAKTPTRLAEQLIGVERAIRDPNVVGDELADVAHLQQVVYRRWARRPDWDAIVLGLVPKQLRYTARANLHAARELTALNGPPPKDLPSWRIVAPAPAEQLFGFYVEAQEEFGVGWQYLAAIHLVETRMGRIRGTSVAGAQGPMQFIPSTWARYGRGDINDNRDAILAAARYLKARGAPQDMDAALFSYNNSTRYVRAVDAYARVMLNDPDAYRGYWNWQVYYNQPGGPVWLPVGYDGRENG